jgi:DMSO/TMAO reductase YedYZ molybdopterin-dependent catalytic subunit
VARALYLNRIWHVMSLSDHEDDLKYQDGPPPAAEQVDAAVIVSPDTRRANRIPPGQSRTRKWPVLHYGEVAVVSTDEWQLEIGGLVERPCRFTWAEFQALPRVKVFSDFHCVTRWSRLGNIWEGVATRELLDRAGVQPTAKFVMLHGYDGGWTTNLPLADFLAEDALLAFAHDGVPLSSDHGGPVRAIVPQLYAWKSAKWIRGIELAAQDRPGYWERGGYHNHGDPWTEERFG